MLTKTETKRPEEIVEWCLSYISRTLDVPSDSVSETEDFSNLGLDSALTTALTLDLEIWLDVEIPLSTFFENRNIKQASIAIAKLVEDKK